MTKIPEELLYSKDHEWALEKNGVLTIGITDHAQVLLGDITYVELPEVGSEFEMGDDFGEIESNKSVSQLYAPITGEVVEINEELDDAPEVINDDPYGSGWMIKIRLAVPDQLSELMNSDIYAEHCASEG
ncbi:MAG: glycine cleavage system protein GcvH [Myxococcota bacterium]|jgi:glycine cleavage system H protein|nr:glycine cleavage system protein GcvH [Myxococcota bacterium]